MGINSGKLVSLIREGIAIVASACTGGKLLKAMDMIEKAMPAARRASAATMRRWRSTTRSQRPIEPGLLNEFALACLRLAPKQFRLDWVKELFEANDMSVGQMSAELADEVKKLRRNVAVLVSGHQSKLGNHILTTRPLFDRVEVEKFVGREWLTAQLDDFMSKNAFGVFLLEGQAGVGKTMFMAHLVHKRRYIHLFGEQVRGEANLLTAFQSLGAQLVIRHKIEPYYSTDTLPQPTPTYEDALYELLEDAVQSRPHKREKVVIVCDAIDEAGSIAGGNVLGLPKRLPEGVYLILSQRPGQARLYFDFTSRIETLEADGADNLRDIKTHLEGFAARPDIAQQMKLQGCAVSDLVQRLTEKSEGVWIYLHYVLRELETGVRSFSELDTLPQGLVGYYTEYWGDWREGRNGRGEGGIYWDTLYAPLLTTLAAAQEPVTTNQLIAWIDVKADRHAVQRLLREKWGAFISEYEAAEGRYMFYHASLRDFMLGNASCEGILSGARYMIVELRERAIEVRRRIAGYYRDQCGGDWPRLVGDDYARRYLSTHLYQAGELETLFHLVVEDEASRAWAEARHRVEGDYAGYLADVELVWRQAESQAGWNVDRQVRCALVESSVRSLAGTVSPDLLAQLVETGLWKPARAFVYIQHMVDGREQAEALARLARFLGELVPKALEVARGLPEKYGLESPRARALIGLAPYLSGDMYKQLLVAVEEISNEDVQAEILSEIGQYLPDAWRASALTMARGLANGARVRALCGLAAYEDSETRAKIVKEALSVAQGIGSNVTRTVALSWLIKLLPPELKDEKLQEVWNIAQIMPNPVTRVQVLSEIMPYASPALKTGMLNELLATLREMQDEWTRAALLRRVVGLLPAEVMGEVVEMIATGGYEAFTYTIEGIVNYLGVGLGRKAAYVMGGIKVAGWRMVALSSLATYMADDGKEELLAEIRGVNDKACQVRALSNLAARWPARQKELVQEALGAVHIGDEYACGRAAAKLMQRLPATSRESLASRTQQLTYAFFAEEMTTHSAKMKQIEAMRRALQAATNSGSETLIACTITSLAEYLPDELQKEVVESAMRLSVSVQRAEALGSLVERLSGELAHKVLEKASQTALALRDEGETAIGSSRIAAYLPEDLRLSAIGWVRSIPHEGKRAEVLSTLAARLPDEQKAVALALVRAMHSDWARAEALSRLANRLTGEPRNQAVGLAREIPNKGARALALIYLQDDLSGEAKKEMLLEAWEGVGKGEGDSRWSGVLALIVSAWQRMDFCGIEQWKGWTPLLHILAQQRRELLLNDLVALSPLIARLGGEAAVQEVIFAIEDVSRWWQ